MTRVQPVERLLLDDNFVASRDIIAVELLIRILHFFRAGQIAIVLIYVVESHLVSWQTEEFLDS